MEFRSADAWRRVRTCLSVVALSVAMAGSGQVGVRASAARLAQQAPASLYQELGGYDGIVTFVALVFPRVAAHPRLTHLFRGHGQDSQQRQFQMVVELVCNRTGGPCTYLGRPMGPVHAGLKNTAEDWSTFMDIVTTGMTELGYAEPLKQRFIEVWKAFRGDVVDADRDTP